MTVIKNIPTDSLNRRTSAYGNYFKELESVSIDDIKSLTQHEFNSIPLTWLYDWAEVKGLLEDESIINWLNEVRLYRRRPRALNCSMKFKFKGVEYGRRIFETKGYRELSLFEGLVTEKYKDREYYPSAQQLKNMNEAYRKFICQYERAKAGEDGFICAQFDKEWSREENKIYLRRLPNFDYQFIVVKTNCIMQNYVCSIKEFLTQCDFFEEGKIGIDDRLRAWVKSGSFPLLQLKDKYLACEIKYALKCATKEDADYLTSQDGIDRFIPNMCEYSSEDIKILSTKIFYRRYCAGVPQGMEMEIEVDGKKQNATWYLTKQTMYIFSKEYVGYNMAITQELYDKLRKMMGK